MWYVFRIVEHQVDLNRMTPPTAFGRAGAGKPVMKGRCGRFELPSRWMIRSEQGDFLSFFAVFMLDKELEQLYPENTVLQDEDHS
jgi:hypothetical protein